jgi:hypothetical protein
MKYKADEIVTLYRLYIYDIDNVGWVIQGREFCPQEERDVWNM